MARADRTGTIAKTDSDSYKPSPLWGEGGRRPDEGHVSELNYLATEEDKAYNIHEWAKLFKAQTWEEIKMLAVENQAINEAASTIYEISEDERIRQQCEAREDYLRRQRGTQRRIAEKDRLIQEKDKQIQEKDKQIQEKDRQLQEKDLELEQLKKYIQKMENEKNINNN